MIIQVYKWAQLGGIDMAIGYRGPRTPGRLPICKVCGEPIKEGLVVAFKPLAELERLFHWGCAKRFLEKAMELIDEGEADVLDEDIEEQLNKIVTGRSMI